MKDLRARHCRVMLWVVLLTIAIAIVAFAPDAFSATADVVGLH